MDALTNKNNIERNVGLDVLKLIAVFLVILSHLSPNVSSNIFSNIPTIQLFFFDAAIKSSGRLGNVIFIAISSIFFIKQDTVKPQKIISILINTAIITWVCVLVCYCCDKSLLPSTPFDWIKKCVFPTILGTNWFILPYILLYAFHPLINKLLNQISKNTHLAIALFLMVFVGFALRFGRGNDDFIGFLTVYIIVSYFTKYPTKFHQNKLFNLFLFFFSLSLMYLFMYSIHSFYDDGSFNNPRSFIFLDYSSIFMIGAGLGLTNLFSAFKIKATWITKLSSTSLIVYLVGSNIFILAIMQPLYFDKFIYIQFGINHIVGWWILGSLCYFIVSILLCLIYFIATNKIIFKFSDAITMFFINQFNKLNKNNISERS